MDKKFDYVAVRAAIRTFLTAIGEDPDRVDLRATPQRVADAWAEIMGEAPDRPQSAQEALKTAEKGTGFESKYDGMVVQTQIPFSSMCEHHLLPFSGHADIGYLAAGQVIGLSKFSRLLRFHARGLQLQERITYATAHSLADITRARGVGVRLKAVHACMTCRGVGVHAPTVTEVLLGDFQQHAVREEFWELCRSGR